MQRGAAQVEGSARVLATGDLDRAVEATVASRMGTQQLRAAAAVVRTADDTLGSLIDTLA
jgi:hypothetical protein